MCTGKKKKKKTKLFSTRSAKSSFCLVQTRNESTPKLENVFLASPWNGVSNFLEIFNQTWIDYCRVHILYSSHAFSNSVMPN